MNVLFVVAMAIYGLSLLFLIVAAGCYWISSDVEEVHQAIGRSNSIAFGQISAYCLVLASLLLVGSYWWRS